MRKLWWAMAGLVAVVLAAAGPFAWRSHRATALERECQEHARWLSVALQMYAQDWDETYPPAQAWASRFARYYAPVRPGDRHPCRSDLTCPAAPNLRCGFALNAAVAGRRLEEVYAWPGEAPFLFESDAGWNAVGGPELLVRRPRHPGGVMVVDSSFHRHLLPLSQVRRMIWRPPPRTPHAPPPASRRP